MKIVRSLRNLSQHPALGCRQSFSRAPRLNQPEAHPRVSSFIMKFLKEKGSHNLTGLVPKKNGTREGKFAFM